MKSYNIHEAKTNFSAIISIVALGEEIIISKAGVPVAVLSPYQSKVTEKRVPGLFENQIVIADDFNEPLNDDFMQHFRK